MSASKLENMIVANGHYAMVPWMKTSARLSNFAAIGLLALTACNEDVVASYEPPPASNVFQTAISEPVGAARNVVYIAFAVDDLPDVRTVRISNLSARTVASTTHAVVNGALDPIPIFATIGDTLELVMSKLDGAVAYLRATVPARRAPRVIRTNPPTGGIDEGLNAKILVVFSEPIERRSISTNTLRLSHGVESVQGTLVLGGPPILTAEFVPARPLSNGTSYTVVISRNIRDLSGEALQDSVTLEFNTISDSIASIPAAAKIAFVSERDGNPEIYAANEDGTGQVRVTFNGAENWSPAWSPDGSRLAFASNRSGTWAIYTVNADGSNLLQRTNTGFVTAPAWSPDGQKIAFGGMRSESGRCIGVISADADGRAPISLACKSDYTNDPAWSPDGSEIAFVSDRDGTGAEGNFDIFVMEADGSRLVQLTRGSGFPVKFTVHPDYARDGRIALLSYWDFDGDETPFVANVDLAVMNPDGTGLISIASAGTTSYWGAGMPPSLTWSPDGGSIAFTSGACSGILDERCSYSIAVVKADGKDKRVVISDGHSPTWRR
jgi:TolB protein